MSQRPPTPAETRPAAPAERETRLSLAKRFPVFESLEFRDFRWMWLGSFASFTAMNMQMITRGWLVLKLTDNSPLMLSLTMVSFAAPVTFVSLIGGALADRISKKRMVMLSTSGNVLLTMLLATLDITGVVAFWHLMVLGVMNGSLMAFNMPSRQAMISEIVPESKLMNAISLNNSAMNLTPHRRPAIAGVLIIYIDTYGVFYLISGIYVFAVLSVARITPGTGQAPKSRKGMGGYIREGLAYVAGNPTLLGLIVMSFIPVLFGFSYYALMPAWAKEALDVGSEGVGMLMMLMGIGALVGTLMLASMSGMRRRGAFLLASCVAWGIALAIFSQATSYALAVPFLLFIGLVSSLFMSLNMTLVQLYTAPEMRGRVMSIGMMTFGVMPLSAVPFGALAEAIGTGDALMVSGILLAVLTVAFGIGYPSFLRIA